MENSISGNDDPALPALATPEVKPRPPHPGFWWAVLWCFGLLLLLQILPMIIGGLLFGVLLALSGKNIGAAALRDPQALRNMPEYAQAMLPAMIISQVTSLVSAWIVIRSIVGKDWPRRLALRPPSWAHMSLILIGLPGLLALSVGIEGLARRVLPSLFNIEEAMAVFGKWPWPIGVLVIGLAPGIGEELWFRGFFGRGLVARYGAIGGVMLTSLLFGLLHLDPRHAAVTMLLGLVLHFSYLATRSLYVPVILHTANNSLGILAFHVPALSFLNASAEQVPVQVFGAAILLTGATGWALWQTRARLVDIRGAGQVWRPWFVGVAYPPPHTTTRVFRPKVDLITWLPPICAVLLFIGLMAPVARDLNARAAEERLAKEIEERIQIELTRVPAAGDVQAHRWRRFDSDAGRFHANFPGEPALEQREVSFVVGKVNRYAYRVIFSNPQISFWLDFEDLSPEVTRQVSPERCFAWIHDKQLAQLKDGRTIYDKAIVTTQGMAGRQFLLLGRDKTGVMQRDETVVETRVFTVSMGEKTRLFFLTIRGIGAKPSRKDVEGFFDSFSFK